MTSVNTVNTCSGEEKTFHFVSSEGSRISPVDRRKAALMGSVRGNSVVQWKQQSQAARLAELLRPLACFFGDKVYEFVDFQEFGDVDKNPFTSCFPVSDAELETRRQMIMVNSSLDGWDNTVGMRMDQVKLLRRKIWFSKLMNWSLRIKKWMNWTFFSVGVLVCVCITMVPFKVSIVLSK